MAPNTRAEPLRVAVYARQSVHEPLGIEQQLSDCRKEAARNGWLVVDSYHDDGTSGSKERGPGTDWARMLKDFDEGHFAAVLVNDVDRLTRSIVDVLEIRPPKRDMRVLTVRGGIDTNDPTHDFSLKLLVLMAEREVKQKAQRTERYAVDRRKAGHPSAGKTPHGYRWVPAIDRDGRGTRFAVVPEEAADVRRIFAEFLAGAPMGQIARDLNTEGRRTRRGAKWIGSTVRRILLNPIYAALLPPSQPTGEHDLKDVDIEACIPGAWEPIIERDHVIASRAKLVAVEPNHKGNARKWLLSGLAVCSKCRAPVRSARGETHPTSRVDGSGKAESKRYHAYRCVNGHFMRNGDIIDEFVSEVCIARLGREDAADLLSPPQDGPDLGVLNARKEELGSQEGVLVAMFTAGKIKDPRVLEKSLDNLASELRSIDVQIAQAVQQDPLAEAVGSGDARAWWEGATLARRRIVIDALMTVAIRPVGYGRRVTDMDGARATVGIEWKQEFDDEE